MRRIPRWAVLPLAGALSVCAALLAGCGGDGDVSSSGSASASGEPVGPGVVSPKPASATQVDVTLREWSISPAVASVAAGQVYFLVRNAGPENAHEFVIVKTDLAPDKLPVESNKVPENKVTIVDEIEPFTPTSSGSIAVNLTAGSYALICNISEVESGQVESHYQLGMQVAFRVQ